MEKEGPLHLRVHALTGTRRGCLNLCSVRRSLDGAAMSELGQGDLWSLLRGFPNLQILTLTDNYIATTLDLSALAESCPLLTELQLDGNAWTGDLSGVHDLTSLEYLNVERNTDTLTGTIPTEIAALTALTELRLGGNALTGTVPWSYLFNATMNLQVLYVPRPLSQHSQLTPTPLGREAF